MNALNGLRIAILITDGFKQVEMVQPREALDNAGASTSIVSPQNHQVRGWNFKDWSEAGPVDVQLDEASESDFDALLLPGGVINPDTLRMQPPAVAFVKRFFSVGKPVAAICHGPRMVIEAYEARGRRIASLPSLKTDLRNAGAQWVDQGGVTDGNWVSARKPDDIPAFNRAMISLFGGADAARKAA